MHPKKSSDQFTPLDIASLPAVTVASLQICLLHLLDEKLHDVIGLSDIIKTSRSAQRSIYTRHASSLIITCRMDQSQTSSSSLYSRLSPVRSQLCGNTTRSLRVVSSGARNISANTSKKRSKGCSLIESPQRLGHSPRLAGIFANARVALAEMHSLSKLSISHSPYQELADVPDYGEGFRNGEDMAICDRPKDNTRLLSNLEDKEDTHTITKEDTRKRPQCMIINSHEICKHEMRCQSLPSCISHMTNDSTYRAGSVKPEMDTIQAYDETGDRIISSLEELLQTPSPAKAAKPTIYSSRQTANSTDNSIALTQKHFTARVECFSKSRFGLPRPPPTGNLCTSRPNISSRLQNPPQRRPTSRMFVNCQGIPDLWNILPGKKDYQTPQQHGAADAKIEMYDQKAPLTTVQSHPIRSSPASGSVINQPESERTSPTGLQAAPVGVLAVPDEAHTVLKELSRTTGVNEGARDWKDQNLQPPAQQQLYYPQIVAFDDILTSPVCYTKPSCSSISWTDDEAFYHGRRSRNRKAVQTWVADLPQEVFDYEVNAMEIDIVPLSPDVEIERGSMRVRMRKCIKRKGSFDDDDDVFA